MRLYVLSFGSAFAVALASTLFAACGGEDGASPQSDGVAEASTPGASASVCMPCVTDDDCGGGVCAQFGGDAFCASTCPNGDECTGDEACMPVSTISGDQRSTCLPRGNACAVGAASRHVSPTAARDAGPDGSSLTCGSLRAPSEPASCKGCTGTRCEPNGCFGGWWCNTANDKCQAPPTTCPTAVDAGGIPVDAGVPPSGQVGPNGGSVSRLLFAVVGDTRPPVINDTAAYPTAVITKIYSDIEARVPRPSFAVSTGDYMFSTGNGTQAAPQMSMYVSARNHYSGVLFPAMGNHECTGAVTSNCGPGTVNGNTNNYATFLATLLTPIGKTSPNYSVNVDAIDHSWTSKFVVVAGNSWTSADSTWLESVLVQPTTYTFIVRHEPKAASTAPGCHASELIMAQHPYTLAIVGHTHTYGKTGPKQVTIGNGGAPLTGGVNFGYGVIGQRADGAIQVDMIDSATGQPDTSFRFALNADGSPAP